MTADSPEKRLISFSMLSKVCRDRSENGYCNAAMSEPTCQPLNCMVWEILEEKTKEEQGNSQSLRGFLEIIAKSEWVSVNADAAARRMRNIASNAIREVK